MVHSRHYKDTYPEDDVVRLCQIGGLYPDDMTEFREELEGIATIYRWESAKYANLPRSKDTARDLTGLIKRISRLDEGLENLPEEATYALRKTIDYNNLYDTSCLITETLPDDAPSLTIPLPETARPVMGLNLRLAEIRHILGGLERAAQKAIETLPKRPSGQLRDMGLRLWMINIHSLWERSTDTPFTRDVAPSGDPVNPAACFCVAAFQNIDAQTPKTRILNEMRHCIRDNKKSNL